MFAKGFSGRGFVAVDGAGLRNTELGIECYLFHYQWHEVFKSGIMMMNQ